MHTLPRLVQKLPSMRSSSAGLVSAETEQILQTKLLTAEVMCVVLILLASEAVDFVPA